LAERFGVAEDLALHDTVRTISEWEARVIPETPSGENPCQVVSQPKSGMDTGSALPSPSSRIHSERHYRLLDLGLRIRYPCEAVAQRVHAVFAHLEMCSGPVDRGFSVVFDILRSADGYAVLQDGQLIGECRRRAALAPLIQREALLAAYRATPCLAAIHAAAVRNHGRCVLMPAAKGSGKSTLTAALLASGYTYLTDELSVLITGSRLMRPAPVSLGLKLGSWPALKPIYPTLESLPAHVQGDDVDIRYLTPPEHLIASGDAYSVTHIVFPRYDAGRPTALIPLSHAEALERIAEGGYAVPGQLDKDRVEGLIDWITGLPCYELSVGELDRAVQQIEGLIG
jgi:hypothetical protein